MNEKIVVVTKKLPLYEKTWLESEKLRLESKGCKDVEVVAGKKGKKRACWLQYSA